MNQINEKNKLSLVRNRSEKNHGEIMFDIVAAFEAVHGYRNHLFGCAYATAKLLISIGSCSSIVFSHCQTISIPILNEHMRMIYLKRCLTNGRLYSIYITPI